MASSTSTAPDMTLTSVDMRTVHGPLAEDNYTKNKDGRGIIDYSSNGLICFPCNHLVIVADSYSCQTIQTLDRHKYPVTRVQFPPDSSMRVCSCDTTGIIIVWDVIRGSSSIFPSNKDVKGCSVISLEWMGHHQHIFDEHKNCLLVLYSSSLLILWDVDSLQVVWKKQLLVNSPKQPSLFMPSSFSLDPIVCGSLVVPLTPINVSQLQCSFIHFESIFSENVSPRSSSSSASSCSSNTLQLGCSMKKYRIFVTDFHQSNSLDRSPDLKLGVQVIPTNTLLSKSRECLEPVDSGFGGSRESLSEFKIEMKEVVFNGNRSHEVIVASSRVVVFLSLEFSCILLTIPLERSSLSVSGVYSCRQRNALFTLHGKTGVVAFRCYQKESLEDKRFRTIAQSQAQTTSPSNHSTDSVIAFCVDPLRETKIALLMSSATVIFLSLVVDESAGDDHDMKFSCLSQMIPVKGYKDGNSVPRLKICSSKQKLLALPKASVIKTCPSVKVSNIQLHRPLVAVGTTSGSVLIIDLKNGCLETCLTIHSSLVRGIEWISLTSFLSFSYPSSKDVNRRRSVLTTSNKDSKVKNELFLTDITTGKSITLRKETNEESPPILGIRVSHLKQYFALSLKDSPIEVWDINSKSLIKVLPDKFASGTSCIEWSPFSSRSKDFATYGKSTSDTQAIIQSLESSVMNKNLLKHIMPPSSSASSTSSCRETFLVSDSSGDLHHYSVEGSSLKQVSIIKTDYPHASLTCLCWRGDQIILGFEDGNLLFWNLKKKESVNKCHHRQPVKKIRFPSGKRNPNFLVLYEDSLELWSFSSVLQEVKFGSKDGLISRVIDVDWINSDRPVLLTSDSTLYVSDMSLQKFSAPISFEEKCEEVVVGKTNLNLVTELTRTQASASFILQNLTKEDTKTIDLEKLVSRCISVAALTANHFLLDFWILVQHHLLGHDIDQHYDLFLNNKSYQEIQQERVQEIRCLNKTEKMKTFAKICLEYDLLSGNFDEAVQSLLDSDSSGDDYKLNVMKACLIASVSGRNQTEPSSLSSAAAMKLSAASLISSGSIDDGIHLLMMTSSFNDVCRFLQSQGLWEKSIWVAKIALPFLQSRVIVDKWLCHVMMTLAYTKDKEVFILLSNQAFDRVVSHLINRHDVQTAALFAKVSQCLALIPSKGSSLSKAKHHNQDFTPEILFPSSPSVSPSDSMTSSFTAVDADAAVDYAYHEYLELLTQFQLQHLLHQLQLDVEIIESSISK